MWKCSCTEVKGVEPICTKCAIAERLEDSYLLQVSVAPWFAISKDPGCNSARLIILHPFWHRAPLNPCNVSSRGIGDIDPVQSAAGWPETGPPCLVIEDAERELAVVIIDFLCPRHTIKVEGQQVSVVNLQERDGELGSWKQFKLQRLVLFHQTSL